MTVMDYWGDGWGLAALQITQRNFQYPINGPTNNKTNTINFTLSRFEQFTISMRNTDQFME
jgi:hypothetical protein